MEPTIEAKLTKSKPSADRTAEGIHKPENRSMTTDITLPNPKPENHNSIALPPNWSQPKYRFGQLVEQGWVVGMRYYPESSALGYQKSEWQYQVLRDWLDDEGEIVLESKIKPHPNADKELQEEINLHLRQIENLKAQMSAA